MALLFTATAGLASPRPRRPNSLRELLEPGAAPGVLRQGSPAKDPSRTSQRTRRRRVRPKRPDGKEDMNAWKRPTQIGLTSECFLYP